MSKRPIVPLNRRFRSLDAGEEESDGALALRMSLDPQPYGEPWDTLRVHTIAVIRAGAGSGKTEEFRQRVEAIRADAGTAFYVRLEKLARSTLESSILSDDGNPPDAFEAWKKKGGPATFFLDALDEARLPRGANRAVLDEALSALEVGVSPWGKATKVILSTRSSEWNDEIDRLKIQNCAARLLGLSPKDSLPESSIGVYSLLPLGRHQVAQLARANEIDAEEFVRAIDDSKIESLSQTPFDVELLLDIWDANTEAGRPGSDGFSGRAEVFKQAIAQKLQPKQSEERRSDLPISEVKRGVQILAAASSLAGKKDFSLYERNDQVLDPRSILEAADPGWNEAKIRQLFSYSFFDPDSGGRVRFSHNEIQDYLAAMYFDEAIDRLSGSLSPIQPLIGRFEDREFLDPTRLNMFGWLACFNTHALRAIVAIQPSLLMETGDPSRYSVLEKEMILRAHGDQYRNRDRKGEWFCDTDLSVFSDPGLASTIAELILHTPSDEFRSNLIDLARVGSMKTVTPPICDIACAPYAELGLRKTANEALSKIGGSEHQMRIRDQALIHISCAAEIAPNKAGLWNGFVLSSAIAFAPGAGDLSEFQPFLESLARERRNHSSGNGRLGIALMNEFKCEPELWLEFFLVFMRAPREGHFGQLFRCQRSKTILLPALSSCLMKCLEQPRISATDVVLDAIEVCCSVSYNDGDFGYSRALKNVAKTLREQSAVKLALLERRWSLLEDRRPAFGGHSIVHPLKLGSDHNAATFWTLDDVEQLIELAKVEPVPSRAQRMVAAADAIIRHLPEIDSQERAYKLVSGFARRSRDPEIRRRFAPPLFRRFHRYRLWLAHQGGFRKMKRGAIRYATWPHRKTRKALDFWKNRHKLRAGETRGFLIDLAHQQAPGTQDGTLETHLEWVRKLHGAHAAKDIKSGYVAIWRTYPTQSLSGESEHWPIATAAARGLEIELADGELAIDETDARRAFAIAFHVLNSVPDWIESFLPQYEDQLRSMLQETVQMALQSASRPGGSAREPLSRIRYAPSSIQKIAAPVIAASLNDTVLPAIKNLEASLSVILHAKQTKLIGEQHAAKAFRMAAASGEWERAWLWMVFMYRSDARHAWKVSRPWIDRLWPLGERSPFIGFMARYQRMMGRRSDEQIGDDLNLHPDILLQLLMSALRTAHPEGDPWHEGAYSPGIRDDAAEQRRYWFENLALTGDKDVYDALMLASKSPEYLRDRDTFLFTADRLARTAAVPSLVPVGDLADFMTTFSMRPRTRDGYVTFVKKLIEEWLHRLANYDHDEGRPFRRKRKRDLERDEEDLRNWLSARLAEAANDLFSVTREPEAARRNRTDLLLTARDEELGCIVVELKLADRDHWTGEALVGTLTTQVRDQYLHEADKHCGLLLLVNTAGVKFRKKLAGKEITFDELVEACEKAAEELNGDKTYGVISVSL